MCRRSDSHPTCVPVGRPLVSGRCSTGSLTSNASAASPENSPNPVQPCLDTAESTAARCCLGREAISSFRKGRPSHQVQCWENYAAIPQCPLSGRPPMPPSGTNCSSSACPHRRDRPADEHQRPHHLDASIEDRKSLPVASR